MENKLIHYFSKMTTLSVSEKKALMDSMTIKTFGKGDYIVKEGKDHQDIFFVLNGLIRQFKMIDGDDITTGFYTEEQWIITLNSFSEDTLSEHNLICMEDTAVVVGDEKKAMALFKEFPRFETISRQVMETVFLEQQNQMTNYITDKPEQRYIKLLASRPDLFQRVPQYDIATYIGVKPESLSRIRKKLLSKN